MAQVAMDVADCTNCTNQYLSTSQWRLTSCRVSYSYVTSVSCSALWFVIGVS